MVVAGADWWSCTAPNYDEYLLSPIGKVSGDRLAVLGQAVSEKVLVLVRLHQHRSCHASVDWPQAMLSILFCCRAGRIQATMPILSCCSTDANVDHDNDHIGDQEDGIVEDGGGWC